MLICLALCTSCTKAIYIGNGQIFPRPSLTFSYIPLLPISFLHVLVVREIPCFGWRVETSATFLHIPITSAPAPVVFGAVLHDCKSFLLNSEVHNPSTFFFFFFLHLFVF